MITRWLALILVVGVVAYVARTVLAPFIIAAVLAVPVAAAVRVTLDYLFPATS